MSFTPQDTTLNLDVVVKWLVPQRVIYVWATGPLTQPVRVWLNTQIIYMYHSSPTPKIHLLVDLRQGTTRERSTPEERKAVLHERRGWLVSVNAFRRPFVRTLMNMWTKLMGQRYRDCTSLDESLAYLQQKDATLPDLRPYWEAFAAQYPGRFQ